MFDPLAVVPGPGIGWLLGIILTGFLADGGLAMTDFETLHRDGVRFRLWQSPLV